jgi:hypothetical protein
MVRTVILIHLAMLLAILQAAPPIPRQTSNPTAGGRKNVKQSSNANQPPASNASAIQQVTGSHEVKEPSQNPPKENKQESVRISELPTVYVAPDWWNRAYVLFTGALVLIIGFGVRYALRTLRGIEQQTKAIVESQRAKIAAAPADDPNKTLWQIDNPRMKLHLNNRGLSVARNLTHEVWIELLRPPFIDFTASANHFKSENLIVLYPGQGPLAINIPLGRTISQDELIELRSWRIRACVRVLVEYDDAFGHRSVTFGFEVQPTGLGYLPKYNDDR